MKLGIISDTHDDIENVQKAINLFIDEKDIIDLTPYRFR
jgi:predicted phosphodiesterase